MINWDSLRIEIWTDGTITPKNALVQAAEVLIPFFQQIVSPKEGKKAVTSKVEKIPQEILDMSVEELELPTRIANALTKGGLSTIAQIVKSGKGKIVKVKNLGVKSIKIIEAALKQKGVELPE
jgi:DNA-directed RNA polymerase subunit alpha